MTYQKKDNMKKDSSRKEKSETRQFRTGVCLKKKGSGKAQSENKYFGKGHFPKRAILKRTNQKQGQFLEGII